VAKLCLACTGARAESSLQGGARFAEGRHLPSAIASTQAKGGAVEGGRTSSPSTRMVEVVRPVPDDGGEQMPQAGGQTALIRT